MRNKKLLLSLTIALQCGNMHQEVLARRARAEKTEQMENTFAKFLIDHADEIRQYDLTPRAQFIMLNQILHVLELIKPDSNANALRKALNENPAEFIKQAWFDFGHSIPEQVTENPRVREIIEQLKARNMAPADMSEEELTRRVSNLTMRIFKGPFQFDLVKEELKYNTEAAVQYLQSKFVETVKKLQALNPAQVVVSPSFAAYKTIAYAEECFKDSPEILKFLQENRTQILMLVTSGEIPKLEEQASVQPSNSFYELNGFLCMSLSVQIRNGTYSLPTKPKIPLHFVDPLTNEQIAALERKRNAFQSIIMAGKPGQDYMTADCEKAIKFIDTNPDEAYHSYAIAVLGFTIDEELDYIANELTNPHFSNVSEFSKLGFEDFETITGNLKTMLKIKLGEVDALPQLNQAQLETAVGKILNHANVLEALKVIKQELPEINTKYNTSESGTPDENAQILNIILYATQRSGFHVVNDLDPSKLRTFLETTNHDLFAKAAECVYNCWTEACVF